MSNVLEIELPRPYQNEKLRQHEQRAFVRELLEQIRDNVDADHDELEDVGQIVCLVWNELEDSKYDHSPVMSMLSDGDLVTAIEEAKEELADAKTEIADLKKSLELLTGLNAQKTARKRKGS